MKYLGPGISRWSSGILDGWNLTEGAHCKFLVVYISVLVFLEEKVQNIFCSSVETISLP